MEAPNVTRVQEFILLGFDIGQEKRLLILIVFAVLYILTMAENITIITVVRLDSQLAQLPMYILLSNFSWLEMCYVTTTVPRMLFDLLSPYGIISFKACFFQFYAFFSFGSTESFFLSAMALDRYLAICHPLHYPQIMNPNACSVLVAICWVLGFWGYFVPVILISKLSFCGPNIIDHFVCDAEPLLSLACPPLGNTPLFLLSTNVLIILGNILFAVLSYSVVILTLIKTSTSRTKAFSTIFFHLLVVTLFYGSVAGMYVTPAGEGQSPITKIVTLFYTAITPLLNPLIYCLRNNQVKEAMGRLLKKKGRWLRRKGGLKKESAIPAITQSTS